MFTGVANERMVQNVFLTPAMFIQNFAAFTKNFSEVSLSKCKAFVLPKGSCRHEKICSASLLRKYCIRCNAVALERLKTKQSTCLNLLRFHEMFPGLCSGLLVKTKFRQNISNW